MKNKHNRPKVGIFGGSFNPPTKGHIKVADLVVKQQLVNEVWLMPCFNHNMGKLSSDPLHRVEMLYRSIKGKRNLIVAMHEILHQSDGKLFNTMVELVHTFPHIDFSIIIGMDCAYDIKKWYNWEQLIKTYPFIVVKRYNYDYEIGDQWFEKSDHRVLNINLDREYSSTLARKAVLNDDNEMQEKQMYRPVIDYIKVNGLYK